MGAGKRFSAVLQPGGDASEIVVAALIAVEQFATEAWLAERDSSRLAVVIEELVSNALRHGAADGGLTLELSLAAQPNGIALVLEDDGRPFDPTAGRDFAGPDPDTGGGVGLELVRAWAEAFAHARIEGRNRLELRLRPA